MSARALPWILACLALLAAPALAEEHDADLADRDRIDALERKVELLTDELERTRQDMGVPEEKPLESAWGLGPAASKVYSLGQGLSIGGYAEAFYTAVVDDKRKSGDVNRFDMLRTVLYTGYKFTDHIVFNAEFEFEHATTSSTESAGSGSVSVEFATLDFLWRDELNARAGILLVPMGFLNEMHEPPFYFGTHRPEVEQVIIPSTFRENGGGLFGRIGEVLEYKLYAITSPNAAGFGAAGLRGGRQKGNRALAEDFAFVGRLDSEPIPQLTLGASVLAGEVDQDQRIAVPGGGPPPTVKLRRTPLVIWETHAELRTHGLSARALFSMAHLGNSGALTNALRQTGDIGVAEIVAGEMYGVYGELGYDVVPLFAPDCGWSVEPFTRIEHVNTQYRIPTGFAQRDQTKIFNVYTVGLQVKPIPQVVLKLDYRNRQSRRGALGDEVNLGFGVVF